MDVIETLLKLPESERQKLLLLLTNAKTNNPSDDSVGPSGTDLKDSINLLNSTSEKPAPKQKTLDSWIVKNKTPTSNCEKEVSNSEEIVPISEKGEGSSSCHLEEVSSTLRDQLPCSSSTSVKKSSKPEVVNKKKLRVLLNRQDSLESKHSEFSFEKGAISPTEMKSPSKKHTFTDVPENSDERIASPEKHSSTPPRSYNLRSARGVSESSSETSNSLAISSESEDRDKNHRSVVKQQPKIKNSVDASPNSSTCLKEAKNDQKNDSSNDVMSKENGQNSVCRTPSIVVSSELEKRSSAVSVDNNIIIITDENPMPAELNVTSVMKGKRKRNNKDKESKKLCVASSEPKSSPNKMDVNSKNAQPIPSKKVVKFSENPSILSIEKAVKLPETKESTSPNQKQISTNDTDKSVSKLKLKKTVKRKDKNDLVSQGKKNLNSTPAKIRKKSLPNPEINSGINKNVVSQNEISDMQLESVTTSESLSKERAKKTEESTKDENSVTSVNADSKKITRKRGNKNKSMKADKNSLLPDLEKSSKINKEDSVSDVGTEISSKTFPSQNKVSTKEIEELLTKDMDTGNPVNVDSKRISRKRGNENKSMKAAKKVLLSDSKLTSKNRDEDKITSIKISPSQNNLPQETEVLIKDANAVIPINKSSKRKIRNTGRENKNTIADNNSLSPDLEQTSKNDEEHSITTAEISLKNLPQSKEFSKESEELLIKDTNTATSQNVGSKRTTRKRGSGNKSVVTTKNSLISDSEQLSKSSDKDEILSNKISSKISLSQNNESVKEPEQLIKDANTANPLNVSSKKKLRKTGSETKNKLAVKNILSPDALKSSKNVKDSAVLFTEILTINSSKNSPSPGKECSEELTIKDTNSSVNVGLMRITRYRGTGNKSVGTTKNSLISNSREAFKNSDKDSITSIKTLETDSSRNSPFGAKEISTKQTSLINTTNEKIILNSSNDELYSFNKMKELPDDESQKSNTVLSNLNKSSDSNALKHQVNALKKMVKVSKDGNQSNKPQSSSDNLNIEMENSDLNLKKNGSKKKVPSLKLKVVRDSSEEHLDVPITKSKVSISNSNVVQEPKHQLLKNLKGQKESVSVKYSKKVKESHSKKKSNLEAQVDSINLFQNDEAENSNLVGESFVKNKLCRTKINKKASVKSADKEESIKEVESDSSPEKTESDLLPKEILDVQMELDTFHSVEKSEISDNNAHLDNSVNAETAQEIISEISMDTNDTSESKKVEHDIIRDIEEIAEKEADFSVNSLNDTDVVQTDYENLVEFDEQMKNNYLDFCKLKNVLKIIGISFKEFFENQEILNCLNSDLPDGIVKIHKCKSDSKISICMHESKKEMNILNKLKRKK